MAPHDVAALQGATLALDDVQSCWRVAAGWADLFADVPAAPEGQLRRHLFRATPGMVLPGVPAADGLRLVAVGGPGCVFEPTTEPGPAQLRDWILGLTEAVAGPRSAWPEQLIATGAMRLAPGARASAGPNSLLWITLEEGEAALQDLAPLPRGEPWPIAAPAVIVAGPAGCSLQVAPPPEVIDPAVLAGFGQAALACIAAHAAAEQAQRGTRALTGERRAESAMVTALAALAGQADGRDVTLATLTGDPLRAALAACCIASGHGWPVPEGAGGAPEPVDAPGTPQDAIRAEEARLRRLLAAARAEARAVRLEPDWWQTEGMPILGWFGEARTPVALLPGPRPGRWRMCSPEGERVVDAACAAAIAPDAWQIYPALPGTPLRVRDVMRWAVRGLGRDFRRVTAMGMLGALLGLALPTLTGVLFDSVVPYGDVGGLVQVAAALLAAAFGAASFELVQALSILRLEARLDGRMQAALMQRLLRLPPRFFRGYTVGELTDRALGVQEAREVLTASSYGALLGAVFGLVSLGLMAFLDWRLALLGTVLVVVLALVLGWLTLHQLRAERIRAMESARVEGFVLQMLSAIGKLRAAAAQPRAMSEWARRSLPLRRATFSASYWASLRSVCAMVLPVLSLACIFAAVSWLAERDAATAALAALTAQPTDEPARALSAGSFVAFIAAFGGLMAAVTEAAMALTRALAALPMLERLRPLLAAVPESPPAAEPPPPLQGAVELRRIRFRYLDSSQDVLRDLSFAIRPGEYVGIVGRSGSGKSTVLRLILGFERPDQGDVWFDGRSTERMDLGALRRSIGVVLQNGRIGQGSLHQAIAGGTAATREDVWAAARLAGLAADIEAMPMGMRTLLPDGAGTLSGGQRQRILLARALVGRPRILVLDEATSALDNRTQAVVTETLASLPITRIVVAHRLSTVLGVDRVLVMDEGRLVEQGKPADLLAANGPFVALARRQML